jgi:diguanylate cyclase (GGDEF)-like protein/PAS domain S-box-containing protein
MARVMTSVYLPRSAKAVLAVTIAAGMACACFIGLAFGSRGFGSTSVLLVLSVLVLASWVWPILMYSEGSSQAHHLDEGFFVVLVLVLPPVGALSAFLLATVIAQLIRRRATVKTLFNVAQITISVSAGIAVVHLVSPPSGRLGAGQLAAAVLGAVVYFLVNSLALALILAATGAERLGSAVLDGIRIRALLLVASVSLGLVASLAVSAYPLSAVLVVLPFLAFRQALAGHYHARHDRIRLLGLFEATLEVHGAMGSGDVKATLSHAASRLLRSPKASVGTGEPGDDAMAASMTVDDSECWLTVSGRSRSEPFDDADRTLLEALAAVGSGALSNSSLYEERRRDHAKLAAITASLAEGVCAFNEDGQVTFLNPAAEHLLGWSERELAGRDLTEGELAMLVSMAHRSILTNEIIQGEQATFRRRTGENFPVEATCSPICAGEQVAGAVLTFRDISQRVLLEYHAFHDSLTGLPNRRIFLDRLQHALKRVDRTGEIHAVLFADIDRFKLTNDSLGHQVGDELLVLIADRLRLVTREGDTLARFGGDEFTLLLENIDSPEVAEATAQRMLEAVCAPVTLAGGRTITASVSIGIALATGGSTPDDVLHDADVAMYQAKRLGAGRCERFDEAAMVKRSVEWLDLEIGLRKAVEQHELIVHYQPVVAMDTGRVVGAEALVRWNHPELGTLSPAHFIGLAEETGLILGLGRKVLEEACRSAKEWVDAHDAPFSVAVNLSARQFQQAEQVSEIAAVLEATGLDPSNLCLEITEGLAMADIDHTIRTLGDLKALGVRLAIDDFGTGYSSLNYLRLLPVDFVKVDQAFVRDLESDPVDAAIVSAIMDLASAVGMTVVAEGVETAGQLSQLAAMGCPLVQGFYLARPMTTEAFTSLLCRQSEQEAAEAHLPNRLSTPVPLMPADYDYEELQMEMNASSLPVRVVR